MYGLGTAADGAEEAVISVLARALDVLESLEGKGAR